MNRRPLDPRKVNVFVDDNALDPNGGHQAEVDRLLALKAAGRINIVVPGGVREEALHPNTPATVNYNVAAQIFSLPVELNESEKRQLHAIRAILQGNAKPGRHWADAGHVFEAVKYGGGYFITHDRRINKTRRQALDGVLPPNLLIVTPAEFLEIYDQYARRDSKTSQPA